MSIKNILSVVLITTAVIGTLFFSFSSITQNAYGQAVSSTITSGVSITISGPDGGGGGGGGGGAKNPATITFSGLAYPKAIVTFLNNGKIIGTSLARDDGTFTKNVTTNAGLITFGIWARDDKGLTSATTNITLSVQTNSTVGIANIFLSPTITADRFKVQRGGTLRIFGSTLPNSLIRLFNNFSPGGSPMAEIKASSDGTWEYFFPSKDLGEGSVSLKVNSQVENPFLVSPFSGNLEFIIEEIVCSGADFNFDKRVNIIDFSILIFYWQTNPAIGKVTNICTDLNTDKIVDIFDFSILMHQWTE